MHYKYIFEGDSTLPVAGFMKNCRCVMVRIPQATPVRIRGYRNKLLMVQVTADGVNPIMCRIANVDKKTVSSQYRAVHLEVSHEWSDYKGDVTLDDILKYSGW